ncbi:hypothetical protein POM88_023760 [Heracleum sosnowskyi]|uniref:Uncharacterized protein n=1 Tax=Heracleum sosnowskyi TaxID=360622 RepID=A0AAD8MQR8_9APIA|nr:hypothetical protein POM88_023760 [Heracleum sosnowskyi]
MDLKGAGVIVDGEGAENQVKRVKMMDKYQLFPRKRANKTYPTIATYLSRGSIIIVPAMGETQLIWILITVHWDNCNTSRLTTLEILLYKANIVYWIGFLAYKNWRRMILDYITNCGGKCFLMESCMHHVTHYSMFKAARMYRMEFEKVNTYLTSKDIDCKDFKAKLLCHKDKPAIINANIGTTVLAMIVILL